MRIIEQSVTALFPHLPDRAAVKTYIRVTRCAEDGQIRDTHLVAACEIIERYAGRLLWAAAEGTAREVVTELELDTAPERWIAPMPAYPDTAAATRTGLDRWNTEAAPPAYAALAAEDFVVGPGGRWRPLCGGGAGIYRVTATATPGDPPANVVEAVLRLTGWYYENRNVAEGLPTLAGAIIKSGAGGLLKNYRQVSR